MSSTAQTTEICTGCDKQTSEGTGYVIGVMCPACSAKWDVLCDAVEGLGGFVKQEDS
jgi:hypothetical protein